MTADLVAFLRARLDEDERLAQAAGGDQWSLQEDPLDTVAIYDSHRDPVVYDEGAPSAGQVQHIASHDPARVLAEVDAKRRILNELLDEIDDRDRTHWTEYWSRAMGPYKWLNTQLLQIMAVPYADHPDYRPEWAPGA